MSRFDDLAGTPIADPKVAEGLVNRALRRTQRLADRGALPVGGIYGDVAAVQDTAAERIELAQRIAEALQAGDKGRASRLIRVAGDLYGHSSMSALVEGQAREGRLAALQEEQDRLRHSEPDLWDDPGADLYPESEPDYLDDEVWYGQR